MDTNMEVFLREDIGVEDVTTNAIVPEDHVSKAKIIAKMDGVMAGHEYALQVFRALDGDIRYDVLKGDGDRVRKGDIVAVVIGRTRTILTGERLALNFLQRLSGIATMTARFMKELEGTKTRILDTRKTTPGLRRAEKYAVRMGGGDNHRNNLTEMALIKDNHISAAGSIKEAYARVKARSNVPVEVEVKDMDELLEALELPLERIMLDNWDLESTREAVALVKGRVPLEASGNMTLDRVHDVAMTGVDYISVGGLTHSVNVLDLSLLYEEACS